MGRAETSSPRVRSTAHHLGRSPPSCSLAWSTDAESLLDIATGGRSTLYWSNTIHLPIPAIQANVEPSTFRSRPYAFSLLGMSLAPLLDIQNLSEIILCGTRTLDQFDTAAAHLAGGTSANKGGTMKGIFKGGSKSGKRPSLGAGGAGGDGPADNYGADYLVVCPQVRIEGLFLDGVSNQADTQALPSSPQPFPPDYFQTMTTFFDMLLELYTKLHSLVAAHAASAASAQSQLHALPTPLAVALEKVYPTLISPSSSTPTSQSPATPLTSVNSASWRQATPQQVQGAFSPAQSTDDVSGIQSPPLTLNGSTLIGGTVRSGSIGGSGETLRQDVVDGIHKLDSRIRVRPHICARQMIRTDLVILDLSCFVQTETHQCSHEGARGARSKGDQGRGVTARELALGHLALRHCRFLPFFDRAQCAKY